MSGSSRFPITDTEYNRRKRAHLRPLVISGVVILSIYFLGQYLLKPERSGLDFNTSVLSRFLLLTTGISIHILTVRTFTKRLGLCCPNCKRSFLSQSRLTESGECRKCSTVIVTNTKSK